PRVNRFLIDSGINGGVVHERGKVQIPSDWYMSLRVLFVDIEIRADKTNRGDFSRQIILIGCYDSYGMKIVQLALSDYNVSEAPQGCTEFHSEREMLLEFARLVRNCDPDIITGWNIPFDITYI